MVQKTQFRFHTNSSPATGGYILYMILVLVAFLNFLLLPLFFLHIVQKHDQILLLPSQIPLLLLWSDLLSVVTVISALWIIPWLNQYFVICTAIYFSLVKPGAVRGNVFDSSPLVTWQLAALKFIVHECAYHWLFWVFRLPEVLLFQPVLYKRYLLSCL